MTSKERLKRQLLATRELSERLLADFQKPEDWVFQVHPGSNHALWFVGHMASTDNFLLSLLAGKRSSELSSYSGLFGMGSNPTGQAQDYPPAQDVLSTMRERRATLLQVLEDLQEEDLSTPTPDGTPDFLPDYASIFDMANWHERQHIGQLTVTRRALGYQPILPSPQS